MDEIITRCRSCGENALEPILSLGKVPLANSLLTKEQLKDKEKFFLLELVFCTACTTVQITKTIPPANLFADYLYFSSFSDTVLNNAKRISRKMVEMLALDEKSFVIEIASNDGYLLKNYCNKDIPVLGIEPAINIAGFANKQGIDTRAEFFSLDLAQELEKQDKLADVIHANNVLAHVPDINDFVSGLSLILKPEGIAVIEVPYIKDLIEHVEFDTIYHEHVFYFSLTALKRLFERHGLTFLDVERIPIHGGSLRLFVVHQSESSRSSSNADQILQEETDWGVNQLSLYQDFSSQIENLKSDLLKILSELKRNGKKIAAYGASAKGATLLNYFGIGSETLDYVVDRSTAKQGLYTPGTHLPIYAPKRLLETKPDYTLLLAWNFAPEIMRQQSSYFDQGGRFIIPIPELRVV